MIVKKWNYMEGYSTSNYGAHSMAVTVGKLTFWFSYDTVIALREDGHSMRVSENRWGVTTGKHLNSLNPNKKERLPGVEFEAALAKLLKKYKLEL